MKLHPLRPIVAVHTPKSSKLEIATYNVLFSTTDKQTKEDLSRLMRRNGVINLQEFDASHRDLFEWMKAQGWGHAHGHAEDAIVWDKSKYKLVDSGSHKLNDPVDGINARGHYPARRANWVRLEDKRTGQVFNTVTVHTIAHNRGAKLTPRVDRVARHQFRELAKLSERLAKHGPVIIGGDLNADTRAKRTWPGEILKDASLRSNWQQLGTDGVGRRGTHGSRFIDHFLTRSDMRDQLKLKSHDIVRKMHSDHDALEATYRLKAP
jgi:endonuclease/exonuclease/phosphatase family metal-dependent hydrolase